MSCEVIDISKPLADRSAGNFNFDDKTFEGIGTSWTKIFTATQPVGVVVMLEPNMRFRINSNNKYSVVGDLKTNGQNKSPYVEPWYGLAQLVGTYFQYNCQFLADNVFYFELDTGEFFSMMKESSSLGSTSVDYAVAPLQFVFKGRR